MKVEYTLQILASKSLLDAKISIIGKRPENKWTGVKHDPYVEKYLKKDEVLSLINKL